MTRPESALAPRLVSYEAAAKYLGISIGTLRSMVRCKQIPHVRLSSRIVRFELAVLDALIEERRVGAKRCSGSTVKRQVRRLLHLSDLHFEFQDQATLWYSQLAADLREQQVERLDALVVSGDLVERANPDEYAAARRFLEQLMLGFGLSPRQVALVPGNHDVSWVLAEKSYHLYRRKC